METKSPGRVLLLLIMWAFLGMGLLSLGGALFSAYNTQKFLRTSVAVQGRVVGFKPVYDMHGSATYAPVFRFDVPGWHFATVVSHTSSNPRAFKIGETVQVHYPTGHPEDAVIDSFEQLWLGDLVFGSVGAMSTGIGLLILVVTRKRNPRDVAPSDPSVGILQR